MKLNPNIVIKIICDELIAGDLKDVSLLKSLMSFKI